MNANEPTPEPPPPTPSSPRSPKKSSSSVGMLGVALLAVAIVGGVYYYIRSSESVPGIDTASRLREYLAAQARASKLAPEYADPDGDLVANAPADKAKLLNPAELTFSAIVSEDPDRAEAAWKPFLDALAKKTGKKVTYLKIYSSGVGAQTAFNSPKPIPKEGDNPIVVQPMELRTLEQQLEMLREGKLHVTALSTGQVKVGVNTAGFVPLFAPASEDGKFSYQLQVIVPAGSDAKSVGDLKGLSKSPIAFSAMSSNSGAKAPLVLFKQDFGMLPGRDYEYIVTGDHEMSILGVCWGFGQATARRGGKVPEDNVATPLEGKYRAACVAGDILQQMVERGEVKAEQFRTVFTSSNFPALCFGVPHNLDPTLRAAIEATFAEFRFEGNSVGERYKAQKRVKFVPVNYKADWKDVRDLDEKLSKLLD